MDPKLDCVPRLMTKGNCVVLVWAVVDPPLIGWIFWRWSLVAVDDDLDGLPPDAECVLDDACEPNPNAEPLVGLVPILFCDVVNDVMPFCR